MYIDFTRPFYLAFLLTIPIIIFLHFFTLRNIRGNALKFANFDAIAKVRGIDLYSRKISLLLFDIFFVIILILALSGLTVFKEVNSSSFSFVVAIDSSQSMSAIDMVPNRLESAKQAANEFIESLPIQTYASIVSFSGTTKIQQELTKNKQELEFGIDKIEIENIGGTDIYDVVFNSMKILENQKNSAIILLSDGQINTGSISNAIEDAKRNNLVIHTIGVGTIEGGNASFGISKIDEDSLKALAYNTGGIYFNAKDEKGIAKSFSDVYTLTSKLGEFELTPYLVILCIFLFIGKQFLISVNKVLW
ncbi:MAG: VWA domain-containing protein [Nanoarchaeota archaeon]